MKQKRITSDKAVQLISFALAMATTWLMVTFVLGSQTPKSSEAVPELKLVTPPPARQRLKPRPYLIAKRWMDIGISSALIVILAPVIGLLALGIALDGKGSPIIKQNRVGSRVRGKGGRFSWETKGITLYKFRTAETAVETQYAGASPTNSKIMYPFGRKLSPMDTLLRRTRFENLPNLFNVLKGDISLVGPRPASVEEAEAYSEKQLRRLEMPAGMTGWWQVTKPIMKGSGVSLDKMIEQDIWYIENKTLRRDLKILLMTPFVVLMGRLYSERT